MHARQGGEYPQTLRDDVLVRRERVPGERLPLDKVLDGKRVPGKEANLGLELVCVARILGEDEKWLVDAPSQFRDGE